jgi:hypothetical protein
MWFWGQEVTWLVLPEAWGFNHCPLIITSKPDEMLTGVIHLARAGCLLIEAIDSILEGTGLVPRPIVALVGEYVTHLPHI